MVPAPRMIDQPGLGNGSGGPVLPSFTQSRTYTYESEDASSVDGADSASGYSPNPSAVMSLSPGNSSAGASPTPYSAKSARFKSAMTTRARQRRMRRMKERGGEGGGGGGGTPRGGGGGGGGGDATPVSVQSDDSIPLIVPRSASGSQLPPLPSVVSPSASMSSLPPDLDRVANAKEHVEQMKSYRRIAAGIPNSAGSANGVPGGANHQSRLFQRSSHRASRGSSLGRGQRQDRYDGPPSAGSTQATPDDVPTPGSGGAAVVVAASEGTPQRSIRNHHSSAQQQQQQTTSSAGRSKSKRANNGSKTARGDYGPSADFLPDWNSDPNLCDRAILSPDEVRDAANFTSIQFQCSNLSGSNCEVEVFSGDDCTASVLSGHDEGASVFSGGMGSIAEERQRKDGDDKDVMRWENEVWTSNNAQGAANRGISEATTPTILRGDEIFHQKAAASIVRLLSPDRLSGAGLMAPDTTAAVDDEREPGKEQDNDGKGGGKKGVEDNHDDSKDVDGDSPTGVDGANSRPGSNFTFNDDPGSARGSNWDGMRQVTRTLFRESSRDEVDDDVRRSVIFQAFRQNMMQPSPQLGELLRQVHRSNGVRIDRAFATRRKNACGALKILSAKEENRMKICWTVGVLPAISSVLADVTQVEDEAGPGGEVDEIAGAANTEARNRIVSTLLNLSVNKKNRMLIVNTPGVLESMMQTIQHDRGESRQGCCTVLLYLAKTAEAREMIMKTPNMLDVLSRVIEVPRPPVKTPSPTKREMKKSRMMAQSMRMQEDLVSPLSPDSGGRSHGSPGGSPGDSPGTWGTGDPRNSRASGRRSRQSHHSSHFSTSRSGRHSRSFTDDEEDDSSNSSDSHTSGGTSHSGSADSHSHTDAGNDGANDEMASPKTPMTPTTPNDGIEPSKSVEQMEISFERAKSTGTKGGSSTGLKQASSLKSSKTDEAEMYDADPNRFLHGARLSVFACLLCLVKSKENAFLVAREEFCILTLIGVSKQHASPSHSRAMAILAHLTRHPKNCHHMVFKYQPLLPMLQLAMGSPDKEARRYAFCSLQNLSMDKSCRAPIAHSPKIILSLTHSLRDKESIGGGEEEEARMAAVATLQNLSDEPANLIQFTIVKDCIGTLIQIAREDVMRGGETDMISFMAKNTLVTLSHWFRKIATSGSERMNSNPQGCMALGIGPMSSISPGGTSRVSSLLHNARLDPTSYDQWT